MFAQAPLAFRSGSNLTIWLGIDWGKISTHKDARVGMDSDPQDEVLAHPKSPRMYSSPVEL
jgi:hypothetical protein